MRSKALCKTERGRNTDTLKPAAAIGIKHQSAFQQNFGFVVILSWISSGLRPYSRKSIHIT